MNEKIRPDHLERAAYVYVRQSSLQQVRHHREANNGSTGSPIGRAKWASPAWS